jgi:hypothetical protein
MISNFQSDPQVKVVENTTMGTGLTFSTKTEVLQSNAQIHSSTKKAYNIDFVFNDHC